MVNIHNELAHWIAFIILVNKKVNDYGKKIQVRQNLRHASGGCFTHTSFLRIFQFY